MGTSFEEWCAQVNAHLESRCGMSREELPETGPMPFDYPDIPVEWEVGTSAIEVAEHILWCVGFPGAEPVL